MLGQRRRRSSGPARSSGASPDGAALAHAAIGRGAPVRVARTDSSRDWILCFFE